MGDVGASSDGPVEVPPGMKFAVSSIPAQTFDLGNTRDLNVSVTAASDFSGAVDLSIERDELDLVDTKGGVVISIAPANLTLAPGETKQATVHIEILTTAASFMLEHFHVVANESGGTGVAVNATDLTVNAVYEVNIIGGPAPENWSAPKNADFVAHTGGVLIRFINRDSAPHRVHSGGAIAHENSDMSPNGGRYEARINPGAMTTASFYCHSHEGGGQAKTFRFNVP